MNENHAIASKGLNTMYKATLLSIVGTLASILTLIPLLGLIIAVVAMMAMLSGAIWNLLGLNALRSAHRKYDNAFLCCLANIAVTVISNMLKSGGIYEILNVVSSALNLLVVWLVVEATNDLLMEMGARELADRGQKVKTLYLFATVIEIGAGVVGLLVPVLALVVLLVGLVVSIWGFLVYLGFLKTSSAALG